MDTDSQPTAEFPKKASTESGGDVGWSVEVRVSPNREPTTLFDQLITNAWKKFQFSKVQVNADMPIGVPHKQSYSGALERYGLMEYAAAQSMRWLLHAQSDVINLGGMGLETRLVEHQIKYTFECTPTSAAAVIRSEDRSDILPDWNRKHKDSKLSMALIKALNPDRDFTAQPIVASDHEDIAGLLSEVKELA